MPGVSLADYTVVGAGSVVTHSTQRQGLVIAGNPAKVVCTVEEYLNKNKDKIVNLNGMNMEDIKEYFNEYPDKLLKKAAYILDKNNWGEEQCHHSTEQH